VTLIFLSYELDILTHNDIYYDIYHYGVIIVDIAKIFENGRSQAVRLPKEYRFDDSEVFVKKINDIVLLIPKDSVWKTFESSLKYFSEDFLSDRNQPEMQKRDDL
jgi:antitoxin VapB